MQKNPNAPCSTQRAPISHSESETHDSHRSALVTGRSEHCWPRLSHTFAPQACCSAPVHSTQLPASQTLSGVPPAAFGVLSTLAQSRFVEHGTHWLFAHRDASGLRQSPLLVHSTQ